MKRLASMVYFALPLAAFVAGACSEGVGVELRFTAQPEEPDATPSLFDEPAP